MHYRADLHSTDIAAEAVAPPSAEYIVNFTGNKRIKNRATLCVSAVFAVGRCLSVRPSVHLLRSCSSALEADAAMRYINPRLTLTLTLYCIQTAKRISRPDSPIILVSCRRPVYPISKGNPTQRDR